MARETTFRLLPSLSQIMRDRPPRLTNTVAFGAANAGLKLATVPITAANRSANRTDAMTFNINLTGGTLPQLPANTYTGTLNIQAQATP